MLKYNIFLTAPEKGAALAYLAGKGAAPARYATAIVVRGSVQDVMEYQVSCPDSAHLQPLSDCSYREVTSTWPGPSAAQRQQPGDLSANATSASSSSSSSSSPACCMPACLQVGPLPVGPDTTIEEDRQVAWNKRPQSGGENQALVRGPLLVAVRYSASAASRLCKLYVKRHSCSLAVSCWLHAAQLSSLPALEAAVPRRCPCWTRPTPFLRPSSWPSLVRTACGSLYVLECCGCSCAAW